jgi:predicted methyltransferase
MRQPLCVLAFAVALAACKSSTSAQPEATGGAAPTAPASAAPTFAPPVTPPETLAKLKAAVQAPYRLDREKERDRYLHQAETLAFFGVRDDMTVVELSPDKGTWTSVLAPVLAEKGHLRVANGDRLTEWPKSVEFLADRFAKDPAVFGKVEVIKTNWAKCDLRLGPDASADMVVTFRNMHDWLGEEVADKVVAEAHRVLRPGGIFGLTDHRAKPGSPTDPQSLSDTGGAYVPEDFMIALVEKAGFRLIDKSEINANPKDTKDYPKGALTLPPQYALGDKDKAKYAAIGETDCMTLKFMRM